MGMSLLSIIEILYYCTIRLFYNFRGKFGQRVGEADRPIVDNKIIKVNEKKF